MKIIISNRSSVPIYEQIKNAIIRDIMTGELEENEPLPSIRTLASDIRISVMTIKKAYDELESEGYIVTRQGKGSFVAAKNNELAKEQAKKEIENHLLKVIELSKLYDIVDKDILDLYEFLKESEDI
ncbi:MAG TPA: GntR family transcriptional regulator [Firmicutes bacterium]|nr:GntR family transcriptional regulator [Bacillota bacterium]